MADENENENEVSSGEGKSRGILIGMVVSVVIALGAVIALVIVVTSDDDSDDPAETEEVVEETRDTDPYDVGPLLEIDTLVVNLDERDATRYLRAGFRLELVSEEQVEQATGFLVPIRSAFLLYFSGLRAQEMRGLGNRERILEELRALANEVMGDDLVQHVYLTEFVVN